MFEERIIMYRTAEALDQLEGMEAQVAHRRFLAGHSHEQISEDLGMTETQARQIAASGLRRIKNYVFIK